MPAHIVLPTYELHPVNAGGAGVFLAGEVSLLARAGHRLTVLCDFEDAQVDEAQRLYDAGPETAGKVRAVSVSRLLAQAPAFEARTGSHWHRKSAGFAEALRRLHAVDPYDVVEFPEYGGAADAALQARAAGTFPKVGVFVRLHGGLEYIDRAEGVPADEVRSSMYAIEARSLREADVLLTPSEAIGRMYAARYGLAPERLVVSPPPMEVLLEGLQPVERLVDPAHFLFYGKLQEVKGCDVLAEAAVRLLRESGRRRWRFTFVGRDTPCTRHGGWVSACLARLIPADAPFDAFEFVPEIDRARLPRLARTPVAAIVPSRFETFCLAAHELRAVGLPLIVPKIPAFEDWLREETGSLTYDGSVGGLAEAILRLRSDPNLRVQLERRPPPTYPPFAAAYERALEESGA